MGENRHSPTDTTVTNPTGFREKLTHIERINPGENPAYVRGLGQRIMEHRMTRYGIEKVDPRYDRTEFAHDDHPEGEKHPYRTTAPAIIDGVKRQPGEVQWLLPHEVGRHHRHAPDLLPKEDHQNERPAGADVPQTAEPHPAPAPAGAEAIPAPSEPAAAGSEEHPA